MTLPPRKHLISLISHITLTQYLTPSFLQQQDKWSAKRPLSSPPLKESLTKHPQLSTQTKGLKMPASISHQSVCDFGNGKNARFKIPDQLELGVSLTRQTWFPDPTSSHPARRTQTNGQCCSSGSMLINKSPSETYPISSFISYVVYVVEGVLRSRYPLLPVLIRDVYV